MKTLNTDLATLQLNQVIEIITDMNNDDTIAIYNDYASHNGYDMIFDNDEHTINDLFLTPYDAIRQTNNKDYRDHENYFTFNGYGHAISFDYRLSENSPIDISELAEWLINEDRLADYDITVTTLDDILASIEDNITDDEMLLNTVCQYLHLNHITLGNEYSFDEKINIIMELINGFNYEQLNKLITDLNINYQ